MADDSLIIRGVALDVDRLALQSAPLQWVALELLNGWSNAGGGRAVMAYAVDGQGSIWVRGNITGGANATIICVLPEAIRPLGHRVFGAAQYPYALIACWLSVGGELACTVEGGTQIVYISVRYEI